MNLFVLGPKVLAYLNAGFSQVLVTMEWTMVWKQWLKLFPMGFPGLKKGGLNHPIAKLEAMRFTENQKKSNEKTLS